MTVRDGVPEFALLPAARVFFQIQCDVIQRQEARILLFPNLRSQARLFLARVPDVPERYVFLIRWQFQLPLEEDSDLVQDVVCQRESRFREARSQSIVGVL